MSLIDVLVFYALVTVAVFIIAALLTVTEAHSPYRSRKDQRKYAKAALIAPLWPLSVIVLLGRLVAFVVRSARWQEGTR